MSTNTQAANYSQNLATQNWPAPIKKTEENIGGMKKFSDDLISDTVRAAIDEYGVPRKGDTNIENLVSNACIR